MCLVCVLTGKMTAEELNEQQERMQKRSEEIAKIAADIKLMAKDLNKVETLTLFTNLLCMYLVEHNVNALEAMRNIQTCYSDWYADKYPKPDDEHQHHGSNNVMDASIKGLKVV